MPLRWTFGTTLAFAGWAPARSGASLRQARRRGCELSRAKHRSLAGHARMSRRVAGADAVLRVRRGPLLPLPTTRRTRSRRGAAPASCGWRSSIARALRQDARADRARSRHGISDLQFTGAYRVPFQFSRFVRAASAAAARSSQSSAGVTVTDLDGNAFYDLTGSYGVNLFGYDFYKECIARGVERARDARPGARRLSSGRRRQRRAAAGDLRAGRGVVPHVGHRGGDAGGAAGALPHAAARIWCASAAPITAGGATCSPASATRCRRARPTR